jgi:hypothetical protein
VSEDAGIEPKTVATLLFFIYIYNITHRNLSELAIIDSLVVNKSIRSRKKNLPFAFEKVVPCVLATIH